MTKAEVQALIDLNLASATAITALKHREVETAILNYIDEQGSGILLKGTKANIDVGSYTITFPDLGTSNYTVLGSIFSREAGYGDNDKVSFIIKSKTSTSFIVNVMEYADFNKDLDFEYILFAR
jgi:hypothetical protein